MFQVFLNPEIAEMDRDYYQDIRLFRSRTVFFRWLGFTAFLASLPLYLPQYHFYLLNLMMVHVIVAVGLNILVGNTGQVSLGHAGFFAVGAYGTALLMSKLQAPFFPALIAGGFIAAFFGFLVGLPALRLRGPYLSIATLAFGLAIMHVIGQLEFFGGRTGIETPALDLGIPQWGISFVLASDSAKFCLFLAITILMIIGACNLMRTKAGRAFSAMRDSDIAAEVTGVNLLAYKTLAFAVSAFYAGIAGGLFAFILGFFNPEPFNLILSIVFLVMVVVGGLGSIAGSVTGAVLITYLQYSLLKNIQDVPYLGNFLLWLSHKWFTEAGLENFNSIILGAILIGIIVFEPLGLHGLWLRFKKTRADLLFKFTLNPRGT